jgi:hypothetical protein
MNFVVAWSRPARAQLADILKDAPDFDRVLEAVREINHLLQDDALSAGEARDADVRIVISPPLAAYYHVRPYDDFVLVFRVWRVK